MVTAIKPYEIRRERTEMDVSHRDSTLTFLYQKYGPGTYAKIGEAIEQDGLATPTMAETASLIYPAFLDEQGKEPEFNGIKNLMGDSWLWAFTGSLYVPNKGAYIEDNPEVRNGMPFMDEPDLEKRLKANDPHVRFVPFGFKIEEMTPAELAQNAYVIALAGEEGAEKLAEVASKHRQKPYLYSFESVDEPLTRVSALNSDWDDRRLIVDGYCHGYGRLGCAFGVLRTGEASTFEK